MYPVINFIMQMVMLYKDPMGEKIFDHGQTQQTINTGADDYKIENYNELEQHCRALEDRLKKHEVRLFCCALI